MKNKRVNLIVGITIIVLAGLIFLSLYGMGKVKWGERNSIVDSNDYYMSITTREINKSVAYHQNFQYAGSDLYSVKLKYAIKEITSDMYWMVRLYNEKDLVQEWRESFQNIEEGQVVEYVLDEPYGGKSENYTMVVETDYEGESGVCLYGSEGNTCLSGKLFIGDVEQEGDITIIVTETKNVKVTLVYAVLLSVLTATALVLFVHKKWYRKLLMLLEEGKKLLFQYKREMGLVACAGAIALLALLVIRKMTHLHVPIISKFSIYHYAFWLTMAVNCAVILIFRKTLEKKPEVVLCMNLLLIGITYIFVLPGEAEISWDEAIHFWRAIGMSNSTTGTANTAESLLYWKSGIPFRLPNNPGNLVGAYQTIENLYQQGDTIGADTGILTSLINVAYVPAAIFINVGKLLGLKLWQIFKLGLIGNLLVYVTNIYFAMKKVVSGKMIVATVSCIGTAFFLATVYSSDSWIMGFSILGFAYFVSCMQKKENLTKKELIIMLGSLTVAFFPKAVYFPMLLILLLLPKEKFESEIQYRKFVAAVFASMTILALGVAYTQWIVVILWAPAYLVYSWGISLFLKMSMKMRIIAGVLIALFATVVVFGTLKFVLPMLVGQGDLRGGDTVNSGAQVAGIIANPGQYVVLLAKFIFERYLNFEDSLRLMFEQYGYLGISGYYYFGIILLVIACLTDKKPVDSFRRVNATRISAVMLSLVSIALISTALYVSFTPVGFYTVIGCQPRYLLPLIYPILAVIGTSKIKNPIKRSYYNGFLILGINLYLFLNILELAVEKYLV